MCNNGFFRAWTLDRLAMTSSYRFCAMTFLLFSRSAVPNCWGPPPLLFPTNPPPCVYVPCTTLAPTPLPFFPPRFPAASDPTN